MIEQGTDPVESHTGFMPDRDSLFQIALDTAEMVAEQVVWG